MCGKTRRDRIKNDNIRERVELAPIVEKMVGTRLKVGHVGRRPVDSVARGVDHIPRKIIRETIKKDLMINELYKNMVFDRTLWCR
jgi:hypothetical protein